MRNAATALRDDQISELDVEGVGQVTVGTTPLPRGVLSAWDPQSKILILNESLSFKDRVVALSRWACLTAPHALCLLAVIPGAVA